MTSKKLAKELQLRTHVVPIYLEWDVRSMWKIMEPFVDGDMLEFRKPDGTPTHWDIVLVRGDKAYENVSAGECNCDLTSGEMCVHWREIR